MADAYAMISETFLFRIVRTSHVAAVQCCLGREGSEPTGPQPQILNSEAALFRTSVNWE